MGRRTPSPVSLQQHTPATPRAIWSVRTPTTSRLQRLPHGVWPQPGPGPTRPASPCHPLLLAKSALETKVATSSTAAKFAAALTAVNTGTGFNITDPGTATDVGTATFTSSTSGASSLLPSMLGLVSALFIAFRHM